MIDLNFLHPYPRYGVAAALVEMQDQGVLLEDLTNLKVTADFAAKVLDRVLNRYTLRTEDKPLDETTTLLKFAYMDGKKVDPGQKSGQTAGNGYYLAPHIITNDKSSGMTVAEVRAIRGLLLKAKEEDLLKPQQKLKRSFAPLSGKINNGRASMAEPKANLLEVAFTAITTLTEYKPASQVAKGKSFVNATIIPDLPLVDAEFYPLIDFVRLFADLQYKVDVNYSKDLSPFHSKVDPKDRKYRRPPIFSGNYPNAPRDKSLGVVSLVAAIGSWAKENKPFQGSNRAAYAKRVLEGLAAHPLYVVSYEEFRQESFGHHLVTLSIEEDLPALVRSAHRAKLINVEKIDDPKLKLYKFFFDRFLQQLSQATFRDFLATRAEYPNTLSPLIEQYMEKEHKDKNVTPELIRSARAYGQSLNRAAYQAAKNEQKEEEEKNKGKKIERKSRTLQELKNRILVQFESTILSAKTPTALLSQMGIIAGRLTGGEIDNNATLFMETVVCWPSTKENLSLAQELVTAFMRLSSYVAKDELTDANTAEANEDEGILDESPQD